MSKLKTKKYNAVANAEKDASQTFVKGAAILTLSMVIVKVFGLLDKVILTGIFSGVSFEQAVAGGTETVNFASFGLGLYSNAYEIFVVIFTVATGGLPIAISRLVSESTAQKRFNDVKQIHRVSIPFFVIVGILSFAILVGASFIYVQIIESPYSLLGMLCLSPTVLFGCLVSIYRGYYEGQRNMFPTAVSEIIEATIKLFIGAFLAYIIAHLGMNSYAESGTVFGLYIANQTEAYQTIVSFSVAGAIMGITLGSAASFVFYILKFKIQGDGIPEEYYRNSVEARSKRETFNKILKTAIPVAMGSLIMSVGSLIDQVIVQRVLLNMIETNPQALQAQYSRYVLCRHKDNPHQPLGLLLSRPHFSSACNSRNTGVRFKCYAECNKCMDKGQQGRTQKVNRNCYPSYNAFYIPDGSRYDGTFVPDYGTCV